MQQEGGRQRKGGKKVEKRSEKEWLGQLATSGQQGLERPQHPPGKGEWMPMSTYLVRIGVHACIQASATLKREEGREGQERREVGPSMVRTVRSWFF